MKFSDDLLKTVSTILEQKPRISFHETGADVLDKSGNKVRSFSRKDLGEKYKKEAENFLSMNYKKLNAESVVLDEKKHKKKDKGDMDGDGINEPDSKEYMDNKDKAIKMAMKNKKMDEAKHDHVDEKKSSDCGEGEYFCKDEQKCKPIPEGMKLDGEQLVKEAVDPSSSDPEKVIGHNCATHVEHKEHGLGECIPGMHTLEETEDGEGYVTHYDVMFTNENGPFIVENVAVEDLEIIHESHHGHMKKKKKMKSEEYSDDVKKKVNQGKMPHPEDPYGHLSGKQREHQQKRDGLEGGYHKGYISQKEYDKGHKKLDKKYGTNYEAVEMNEMEGAQKPVRGKDKETLTYSQQVRADMKKKREKEKGMTKEHVDSIAAALQEISTKTMRSYVGKAKADMAHHQNILRAADRAADFNDDPKFKDNPVANFHKKEEKKRKVGIGTALDKIAKKSIDKDVKNESNEMTDRMADHIGDMPETSHRKKVAKKKAMKAFDKGDYEKAADHAGIHLQHPD
mgnify:CR=1 FL=1